MLRRGELAILTRGGADLETDACGVEGTPSGVFAVFCPEETSGSTKSFIGVAGGTCADKREMMKSSPLLIVSSTISESGTAVSGASNRRTEFLNSSSCFNIANDAWSSASRARSVPDMLFLSFA